MTSSGRAENGWEWENENTDENTGQRDKLEEWFSGLVDERRDETIHEILLAAWNDFETVGHGAIELARDPSKKVRYMYPMPAHTIRFGREGVRVVQIRQGKRVWFKRWIPNDERVVGAHNGVIYENRKAAGRVAIGNEVLILKRPARRSTWYGIPSYVSALGWLTLSVLARDDNILYFDNRREPRWAIVLTNLDDDPDLEDDLREAFRVDLKQPHRNLIIPIEGPGNIDFKQLTDLSKNDMSFDKLQSRSADFLLVAHKVPADRLGLPTVGALGGNVTVDANRVYKEAVVQTGQAILAARINRFIIHEGPIDKPTWKWAPNPLDLTEEASDSTIATTEFQAGLITLNEARRKIGEEELPEKDPRGSMYITELGMQAQQAQQQQGGDQQTPEQQQQAAQQQQNQAQEIAGLQEQLRTGNPDEELGL